jgi:Yip1 domain
MSDSLEQQPFKAPPPPPQPPSEPPARRPTRLRPFAIGFFALGAIIAIGGVAKFIPGGIGTGASLCFLGLVWFGLSFIPLPRLPDSEPPIPFLQKFAGMFFEPTRIYKNLRIHPHWIAAFVLVTILGVIYSFAFVQRVTPERIVNHTVDKIGEMGPPFAPPPEMLDQMRVNQMEELKNPVQRAGTAVKAFVFAFAGAAAIAALYLLGVLAFGGRINFWQALAVYFHAAIPITVISKILSLVILYIKPPEDIHPILGQDNLVQDNLGILFSPASNPVLFVLASSIGILSFYSLWLRARGLQHGGTRVSSGAAWGVAITFWVLGLLLVTIITALFPGFIG